MTDSPADILASPPVNLRDLGGIAVGGGAVRAGFALRADDLSTIPAQVADELVAGGLRAVIDLRSAEEFALTGRGPLGRNAAVSYHHIPFQSDVSSGARTAADMFDQT
ncbi:tyrosine-protein phosphatase, partial [Microbacterium sp.]|uniref:tyrosine-protein phosphatase n=1 Tax=Microbacterium sp. TaxID=51671 RepID=UPI003A8C5C6F